MKQIIILIAIIVGMTSCATQKSKYGCPNGLVTHQAYIIKATATQANVEPVMAKKVNPKNFYAKTKKQRTRIPGDLPRYNY